MSDDPERAATRPLSADEARSVLAARQKAFILYEGVETPHRSCGICLAEVFNLPTAPYQALRRGGITGEGECGAIVAGRLVLGQLFGDPDPTGATTEALQQAINLYTTLWRERVDRREAPAGRGEVPDMVCNTLTSQFPIFRSPERAGFCTHLSTEVATAVAEVCARMGRPVAITPIDDVPRFDPGAPEDPL